MYFAIHEFSGKLRNTRLVNDGEAIASAIPPLACQRTAVLMGSMPDIVTLL
jgi:hypothetical protein